MSKRTDNIPSLKVMRSLGSKGFVEVEERESDHQYLRDAGKKVIFFKHDAKGMK